MPEATTIREVPASRIGATEELLVAQCLRDPRDRVPERLERSGRFGFPLAGELLERPVQTPMGPRVSARRRPPYRLLLSIDGSYGDRLSGAATR